MAATATPQPMRRLHDAAAGNERASARPLDQYFHDLTRTQRLAPAQELRKALLLRTTRVKLWAAVLATDPSEVLAAAEGRFDGDRWPKQAVREFRKAAKRSGGANEEATLLLVQALCEADRDGAVANHLVAQLVEDRVPEVLAQCRTMQGELKRLRDEFVAANLGLVVVVARRYESRHLTLADLIQEGNTGLLKAVDRFDPERGFRFSTYAVWWIRHAIGRALSDKSREIRLPVHVAERQQTVLRAKSAFLAQHGRDATPADLAQATGLPEAKIVDLLSVEYTRAMATGVGAETMGPLEVDNLPSALCTDADDLDRERLGQGLRDAMRCLPAIQQDVLRKRFGLEDDNPLTLREVGVQHALSRERIRQLQERALTSMRREFQRQGLTS